MTYKDKVLLTLFVLVSLFVWMLSHSIRTAKQDAIVYHQDIPITNFMEGWDEPLIDMTNTEKEIACKQSRECSILAEAVVYEARSESMIGQYAVAEVIVNRVESRRWPNTVRGVVYQMGQFEYVTNMHIQKAPTKKDWTTAYVVAYNVKHKLVDPITHSDHYLNPKAVKKMPRWTKKYRYVMTIGNHQFYASN